jgi:hypothetical protein
MLTSTGYPAINLSEKKNYVSHYMPHRIDNNRIVSLKTSLKRPSSFVITNESGGTEHVLTTTDIYPYIFHILTALCGQNCILIRDGEQLFGDQK